MGNRNKTALGETTDSEFAKVKEWLSDPVRVKSSGAKFGWP